MKNDGSKSGSSKSDTFKDKHDTQQQQQKKTPGAGMTKRLSDSNRKSPSRSMEGGGVKSEGGSKKSSTSHSRATAEADTSQPAVPAATGNLWRIYENLRAWK